MVALSVASKPLALAVTPDLPVSVPASSVITWSGGAHAPRGGGPPALRGHAPLTSGPPAARPPGRQGPVLVEQATGGCASDGISSLPRAAVHEPADQKGIPSP